MGIKARRDRNAEQQLCRAEYARDARKCEARAGQRGEKRYRELMVELPKGAGLRVISNKGQNGRQKSKRGEDAALCYANFQIRIRNGLHARGNNIRA